MTAILLSYRIGSPTKCSELRLEQFAWISPGTRLYVGPMIDLDLARTLNLLVEPSLRSGDEVVIRLRNEPLYQEKQQAIKHYLESVARNARPQAKPSAF
ncbi:MAG: hypothetical protein LVT47_09880 [Cyanobacteria bacterium LVE1205-1]|jgi:hypothetical protein